MEKPKPEMADIELEPDAWLRFEKFIKTVAKAGPQHRTPSDGPKRQGADANTPAPKVSD